MKNQWDKGIHIIRHRGQPNRAQLPDGKWVERQESLWIPEWGGFVMCAPYSDHFVYSTKAPGSGLVCTCGSSAGIVGPNGYIMDASPQGKMVVCLAHAQTGQHVTGGTQWI